MLTVKLVRSLVGHPRDQRDTVRSLGLRRLNYERTIEDNSVNRGMLHKVRHLVEVRAAGDGA